MEAHRAHYLKGLRLLWLTLAMILALGAAGCSDSSRQAGAACRAGMVQACTCDGGVKGIQVCTGSGIWENCDCNETSPEPTQPEPVKGFVDLHNHQMGEYAFGGAWFHGSHKGSEDVALAECDGGFDHAGTVLGPLNEFISLKPGTWGDTGLHLSRTDGYPFYEGWPRWDTIAHQQMWEGHLKQAHDAGLAIYIMSAMNFRPLCELMPEKNRIPELGCQDHTSVDIQLTAATEFAEERDWIEIARSPDEAREIIHSGKLAMVLAIEISDLFPEGDVITQLDHYYSLGVRSIQLAHQLDNRFSGAAPHHFIFKFFQFVEDIKNGNWENPGFELDEEMHNMKGLTKEGKDLLKAMMDKNMIVDLAHLSERSIQDAYEIAKEYNFYPLIISHGHFRSIMMDEKQSEEKTTPDWVVRVIRKTGGMFGLRSGAEKVKTYIHSTVENNCDGSSKSFAQAYQYGVKGLKVDVAFASDFNGFIQQLRPRFGGPVETCGASGEEETIKAQQENQTEKTGSEFDTKGFAHIGLIGDIIKDLKTFGVDTADLENSAETFLNVWQRGYDSNRGELTTDDMDTSGIESF